MVQLLVQCAIITLWSAVIGIHTRRLLRLTRVAFVQGSEPKLRHRLERLWWWLGREEFWRSVYADGLRCTQMTFMVFLLVVGAQ